MNVLKRFHYNEWLLISVFIMVILMVYFVFSSSKDKKNPENTNVEYTDNAPVITIENNKSGNAFDQEVIIQVSDIKINEECNTHEVDLMLSLPNQTKKLLRMQIGIKPAYEEGIYNIFLISAEKINQKTQARFLIKKKFLVS